MNVLCVFKLLVSSYFFNLTKGGNTGLVLQNRLIIHEDATLFKVLNVFLEVKCVGRLCSYETPRSFQDTSLRAFVVYECCY